jgi:hypothetical protein
MSSDFKHYNMPKSQTLFDKKSSLEDFPTMTLLLGVVFSIDAPIVKCS